MLGMIASSMLCFFGVPISSFILLAIGASTARIWYAIPLVIVVSLVYGATRHENLREIFIHSYRSAVWVVGFMLFIFALIWTTGFWN